MTRCICAHFDCAQKSGSNRSLCVCCPRPLHKAAGTDGHADGVHSQELYSQNLPACNAQCGSMLRKAHHTPHSAISEKTLGLCMLANTGPADPALNPQGRTSQQLLVVQSAPQPSSSNSCPTVETSLRTKGGTDWALLLRASPERSWCANESRGRAGAGALAQPRGDTRGRNPKP